MDRKQNPCLRFKKLLTFSWWYQRSNSFTTLSLSTATFSFASVTLLFKNLLSLTTPQNFWSKLSFDWVSVMCQFQNCFKMSQNFQFLWNGKASVNNVLCSCPYGQDGLCLVNSGQSQSRVKWFLCLPYQSTAEINIGSTSFCGTCK